MGAKGHCAYGDNCFFTHGPNDKRDRSKIMKTKVCENWVEGNYTCTFGEAKCIFLHPSRKSLEPPKKTIYSVSKLKTRKFDPATIPSFKDLAKANKSKTKVNVKKIKHTKTKSLSISQQ